MPEHRPRGTAIVAVSLAAVALVTALTAAVVVARRGDGTPVAAADVPARAVGDVARHRVAASEVVKLDQDTVDIVADPGGSIGLKVTDAALRTALDLSRGDVITSISGRPVKKPFDVYDALLGASMMRATAVYVELTRDGAPMLLRWELDGDLRTARLDRMPATSGSSVVGSTSPSDPLLATIKRIDATRYEVPQATIDAVIANPMMFATGARIIPAVKDGKPHGFKLYAIRSGSLFAAVGLHNGDTLLAINGMDLADSSAALDVFTKLKTAKLLRVDFERLGVGEVIEITITR